MGNTAIQIHENSEPIKGLDAIIASGGFLFGATFGTTFGTTMSVFLGQDPVRLMAREANRNENCSERQIKAFDKGYVAGRTAGQLALAYAFISTGIKEGFYSLLEL